MTRMMSIPIQINNIIHHLIDDEHDDLSIENIIEYFSFSLSSENFDSIFLHELFDGVINLIESNDPLYLPSIRIYSNDLLFSILFKNSLKSISFDKFKIIWPPLISIGEDPILMINDP